MKTVTVSNRVIVGICITLCSNGLKINNSPQESLNTVFNNVCVQLLIYLCVYLTI